MSRTNLIHVQLDRKRDLYSLSLTSRAFEDIVLARLYAKVDVEIPQYISVYWKTGSSPVFRPHIIQAVKELSVRNAPVDFRGSYNRRRRSDAGCVDCQIRDLVENVPREQLMSFS